MLVAGKNEVADILAVLILELFKAGLILGVIYFTDILAKYRNLRDIE